MFPRPHQLGGKSGRASRPLERCHRTRQRRRHRRPAVLLPLLRRRRGRLDRSRQQLGPLAKSAARGGRPPAPLIPVPCFRWRFATAATSEPDITAGAAAAAAAAVATTIPTTTTHGAAGSAGEICGERGASTRPFDPGTVFPLEVRHSSDERARHNSRSGGSSSSSSSDDNTNDHDSWWDATCVGALLRPFNPGKRCRRSTRIGKAVLGVDLPFDRGKAWGRMQHGG